MYLIDAEKAEQDGWVANRNVSREFTTYIEGAKLTDFPAVDAVPVVRCTNCRYCDESGFCFGKGRYVSPQGYCSSGRPRQRVAVRRKKHAKH